MAPPSATSRDIGKVPILDPETDKMRLVPLSVLNRLCLHFHTLFWPVASY